jgi:ribosomal protein S18 acetylase RimI-like enzyme
MTAVREFESSDWESVWAFIEPVFRAGDTYSYPVSITESAAFDLWVEQADATFVVEDEPGHVVGTYFLKPNQPGQGSHVCNCAYIVARAARGRGLASAMCLDSQRQAIARGFRAMQFNLVVATNTAAVSLWKTQGFAIAGTLPGAFLHPSNGYVDAYVMYKQLQD